MRLLLLLILSFLVFTCTAAPVDDLVFGHLSNKHGLSHSSVTSILQDKEGFMWFGTRDGLNRFDGYSFLLYEHNPTDIHSLSDNQIKSMYEDQEGNIWIGTANGLNKLDKKTNTFIVYQHDPANSRSINHYKINSIYEDKTGALWIGTYAGLNRFDKATQTFSSYQHEPGNPDNWTKNAINTIYEDQQGNLWLGTNQGLSLFDRKNHTFTRFGQQTSRTNEELTRKDIVRQILEDKAGVLWIATSGNGLLMFDRKTHTFTTYFNEPATAPGLGSKSITSLLEDSFGTLWVGTQDHGLSRFDRNTQTFTQHQHDPKQANTISDDFVTYLYEDRSKVVWVATFNAGLNKIDLVRKKISHLKHDLWSPNSLRSNYVSAILEDRSGIGWIGNADGLDKLDRMRGRIAHYTYSSAPSVVTGDNTTNCIYEDKTGMLWIGLHGGGLRKFNPVTQQFTNYWHDSADSTSLPHGIVNTIYQDKAGILWVGTRTGLVKFEQQTNRFRRYSLSFSDSRSFNIIAIQEYKPGQLLVTSTNNGLYKFDCANGIFRPLLPDDKNFQQICHDGINLLFRDKSGYAWLGLQSGGLLQINQTLSAYKRISQPAAVAKAVVMAIQEDAKGNLWLSTSKNGMYKFNPANATFTAYDALDGFQSNEFSAASFQSATGEFYFGGPNGLNLFHPDSIRPNTYAPPVAISGFKVFDKPRSFSDKITLPYSDTFFSFDFVALSYALPEKNQYAYQLEGFDETWIQAGSRRYASYTNLDPGTYTFRVKAANHDGVWNEKGTSVTIHITPPLWRTHSAYLAYICLLIGLGYAFRNYTVKQERLKNTLRLKSLESAKLQELDQLKSRFFTSISHEFRTPLTLILTPLEKKLASLDKSHPEERETKVMHRNAKRLLELINQLLDISKLEAGKMQMEVMPGDIISQLKSYVFSFLSLAESKQIRFTCNCEPDSFPALYDRDKLEKIVTNLLSNAVKFTSSSGVVEVNICIKASVGKKSTPTHRLCIEVKDTGIGIPADRIQKIFDRFYQVDTSYEFEGTGIGLALTKELVELHQGTIHVVSEVGKGTCFTLELPLQEIPAEMLDTFTEKQNAVLPSSLTYSNRHETNEPMEERQPSPDTELPLLLIVEDNTDLRRYIRSTFQQTYRIAEATNGEEGLQLALDTIPDLIISDWMMPKMDGMQLCRHLRTDERSSHIPIILLTANATMQSKIEGLETGADDYMIKPFNAVELSVRVQNLITQRKKLRERFNQAFAQPPVAVPASAPASAPVLVNPVDEKFLQRVIQVIEVNLEDPEFSIEMLEKEVGMSHVHLNRKLKALTDQTPSEFLRNLRLKKAALLLSQKGRNVSEVAYEVGFVHLSYFTKCFRQVYGLTPSQYASAAITSASPANPKSQVESPDE